MAQINFNANQVAPDEGRTGPIPADWYLMAIDSTEIKPTSTGTGTIMAAVAKVLEGQYAGRKVFINFNIQNQSVQAQEIGQKQLSALCHATRVLVLQDTVQLHNVPFRAKVKVRAAQGQYDESNEITAYRDQSDPAAVSKTPVGINLAAPAPNRAAPPPPPAAAAPQYQAPPPPTAQQAQWNPPAAQQPWQGAAAPAQQPPVQQAAPQYQAPPQDPNVQQAQQVQPSWAGVPAQTAPAPQQTAAPSQAAAPVHNPNAPQPGAVVPPWMAQAPQ